MHDSLIFGHLAAGLMRHIVNECPLTCFDGGISELHQSQLQLAAEMKFEIVKANDNGNNREDMNKYELIDS